MLVAHFYYTDYNFVGRASGFFFSHFLECIFVVGNGFYSGTVNRFESCGCCLPTNLEVALLSGMVYCPSGLSLLVLFRFFGGYVCVCVCRIA